MNQITDNMDAIIQILEAAVYIFIGWAAKWIQRNQIDNQKKKQ